MLGPLMRGVRFCCQLVIQGPAPFRPLLSPGLRQCRLSPPVAPFAASLWHRWIHVVDLESAATSPVCAPDLTEVSPWWTGMLLLAN